MIELLLYLAGAWTHWQFFVEPKRARGDEITSATMAMVAFWPLVTVVDMISVGWLTSRRIYTARRHTGDRQ